MIIAWCLEDIVSYTGGKKGKKLVYETKGKVVKVIDILDTMIILENRRGLRFSANKSRVIWHNTRSPET